MDSFIETSHVTYVVYKDITRVIVLFALTKTELKSRKKRLQTIMKTMGAEMIQMPLNRV